MLCAGLVSELGRRVVVHIESVLRRAETGCEQHERVAVLSRPAHGLHADGGRNPYLRMRLLVRAHPGVHVAVVIVLALPAERSGVRPCLDNEVVRLLEALAIEHGRRVVRDALASAAAHEARHQPASADHVYHRKLLRQPERIVPDWQDVAQYDDLRLRRLAGEDGRADVGNALHTERGAVMLIEHQAVEAHLLRVQLLVQIPVVERRADLRVVHLVADAQVCRLRAHQPGLVILPGLLGEMSYKHDLSPAAW